MEGDSSWVDGWATPPVPDHPGSDKLVIPCGGKGGTLSTYQGTSIWQMGTVYWNPVRESRPKDWPDRPGWVNGGIPWLGSTRRRQRFPPRGPVATQYVDWGPTDFQGPFTRPGELHLASPLLMWPAQPPPAHPAPVCCSRLAVHLSSHSFAELGPGPFVLPLDSILQRIPTIQGCLRP